MNITTRIGIVALALTGIVSPIVATAAAPASAATATAAASSTELSGASGNGVADGTFGAWRGAAADIAGTWSDDDTNSVNFWQFQSGGELANWTKPVDVAVGAIDSGETWQAAASGAYDARWAKSLTLLKSLRANATGATYIRFAHEMNGYWYPWSVNSTNYTYFDAAWKRYRALQRQIFPTSKLVFSVNRQSVGAGMDWRTFFPGKAYVDVLSVDDYNEYPYISTDAEWNAQLSAVSAYGEPEGLDGFVSYAKSQGLPLAISEWSGDAADGDSPTFIKDMLTYVKSHGGSGAGQILYDILFNVGGYGGDYQLFGPDAAMPLSSAAYKSFFTTAAAQSQALTTTPAATPGILSAGSSMTPGQALFSPNGAYRLLFQTDGNLVVYNSSGKAIWNASTQHRAGTSLVMQTDSNFVLYTAAKKAIWNTKTDMHAAGARLAMQSDGNLVVYSAAGKALWASRWK